MYNGGKIIFALAVFLIIATIPFTINLGKASAKIEPKLDTPEIMKLDVADRKCVESKEFMRAEHMQLLNNWRDSVLRDGQRIYVSSTGKHIPMSLQNTCMKCHSNKSKFCDACHNYVAVKPYCWDCHIAPKESQL